MSAPEKGLVTGGEKAGASEALHSPMNSSGGRSPKDLGMSEEGVGQLSEGHQSKYEEKKQEEEDLVASNDDFVPLAIEDRGEGVSGDRVELTRVDCRPGFYLWRSENTVTPMVAVDELPSRFIVGGVKRAMTAAEAERSPGFKGFVGPLPRSEFVYDVRLPESMKRLLQRPSDDEWAPGAAWRTHLEPGLEAGAARAVNKRRRLSYEEEEEGLEAGRSASLAAASLSGQSMLVPSEEEQRARLTDQTAMANRAIYEEMLEDQWRRQGRVSASNPAHLQVAESDTSAAGAAGTGVQQVYNPLTRGIFGRKLFCSHWLRTGECDFTQQGCNYLHVMPDVSTMETLNMRVYPRWFREMPRNYQVENSHSFDESALFPPHERGGVGAPSLPSPQHAPQTRGRVHVRGGGGHNHGHHASRQHHPYAGVSQSGRVYGRGGGIAGRQNIKRGGSGGNPTSHFADRKTPAGPTATQRTKNAPKKSSAGGSVLSLLPPPRPESSVSFHVDAAPTPLRPRHGQTNLSPILQVSRASPAPSIVTTFTGPFGVGNESYQPDFNNSTLLDDYSQSTVGELRGLQGRPEHMSLNLPAGDFGYPGHIYPFNEPYNTSSWNPLPVATHTAPSMVHSPQAQSHHRQSPAAPFMPATPFQPMPGHVTNQRPPSQAEGQPRRKAPRSDAIDLTASNATNPAGSGVMSSSSSRTGEENMRDAAGQPVNFHGHYHLRRVRDDIAPRPVQAPRPGTLAYLTAQRDVLRSAVETPLPAAAGAAAGEDDDDELNLDYDMTEDQSGGDDGRQERNDLSDDNTSEVPTEMRVEY